MIRKIYKGGKYSYVIAIPKEIIKELKWKEGQFVEVTRNRNSIEIKDSPSR